MKFSEKIINLSLPLSLRDSKRRGESCIRPKNVGDIETVDSCLSS